MFIDKEGTIESPDYPLEYPINKTCTWRISVPENYQIALRFKSFDLEQHEACAYDRLTIRDGAMNSNPLIKTLCGYRIPTDIVSTSNHLWVQFHSDASNTRGGFAATIIKERDECASNDHGCEHECINHIGYYECKCRLGFEFNSVTKKCQGELK